MKENSSSFFVETVSHLNLVDMAVVCREQRTIGLCFGKPGVGKTTSAKKFCKWAIVEANFAAKNGQVVEPEAMLECDTLYYLPSITVSAARLRSELTVLRNRFEDAISKSVMWQRPDDWATSIQEQHVKLVIVDEAYRLKFQALEELRDLQERWNVGVVLIGDPGFERSLGRMWHFNARVTYAEELKPLTDAEVIVYIDKQLELMTLPNPPEEVYSLITWYSKGNLRALGNLFAIIARILKLNDDIVTGITKEVVETAREMMLFGLNGT